MRIVIIMMIAFAAACCTADISLDLRPDTQTVNLGDTVSVALYAVSDEPVELMSAMDVIISWDPAYLNPIGFTNAGTGHAWLQSGFLYPGGPNASLNDGDAIWTAFAQPGDPAAATPSGLLVTTFQFPAVAPTPLTLVIIVPSSGQYRTVVYDGTVPNLEVTGTLDPGAEVTIIGTTTVSGHVDLEFYEGGAGIGADLEFRDPGTFTVLHTTPIMLDGSGNYVAPGVPIGTYDVALKFVNWLRQVHTNVAVSSPGVTLDFFLKNGDSTNDNSVDILDINQILIRFGAAGGVGNLTWDASVDIEDLNIAVLNFSLTGDP